MTIKEKALKKVADAYYGKDVAIGDGTFLEMLLDFFMKFLGNCPLGAKRAHAMATGGVLRKALARSRLQYAAYFWTNGDADETKKITDAGMSIASASTEKEFVEFATLGN